MDTNFDSVKAATFTGNLVGNQTGGTSDIQGTVLTAIDLSGGDVTLTAAQAKNTRLEVTTGHATNAIIVPTGLAGKVYVVSNAHATLAANIKVASGTAVAIAATKSAIVQVNGAGDNVKRVTTDA